jgi:hypothetical protein
VVQQAITVASRACAHQPQRNALERHYVSSTRVEREITGTGKVATVEPGVGFDHHDEHGSERVELRNYATYKVNQGSSDERVDKSTPTKDQPHRGTTEAAPTIRGEAAECAYF